MAPLQFGILLIPFQSMDVSGPIDILRSCSPDLINRLAQASHPGATSSLALQGVEVEFHHIAETLSPVTIFSGFTIIPTTTIHDCPPLDYLIIGGPDPETYALSPGFTAFVQDFVEGLDAKKEGEKGGLFTTCTGALTIAKSGVLDGRNATTNKGGLAMARELFPNVAWQDKQWVVDGRIWTAGGACAGMDMFVHWIIENHGRGVAEMGCFVLDLEPRDIEGKRVLFIGGEID